jgi:hypothetical protein
LKHHASPAFWDCYHALPENIQDLAKKNFAFLKEDPSHPSLHFKKIDKYFSARVGLSHRVLGVEVPDGVLWFWIGSHAEYDKIVGD